MHRIDSWIGDWRNKNKQIDGMAVCVSVIGKDVRVSTNP